MTSVTVVIPCHNCERYIAHTLRGIVAQTRQPEEVLIVNDASTDGSVDVIRREYPDATIIDADCRNAAAARNIAIERARTDHIAFLDGDDWWYPHHLETALVPLGAGDAAFLGHRDFARESDANVTGMTVLEATRPLPIDGERHNLSPELFLKLFFPSRYYASSGLVARRDAILDGGMFDPSYRRRHDIEMFLRLIKGRTWACSGRASYAYRVGHAGTISSNRAECEWFLFQAMRERVNDFPSVDCRLGLRRIARVALGAARRSGDDALLRQVATGVWDQLTPRDQLMYLMLHPKTAWTAATGRAS